jgi:hypothetical protein
VNNLEPSGLQWIPTLFFGVLKWELFRVEEKLGWVIETTSTTGDITWCALDNRGESLIKPMVCRGTISDCAHALVNLVGIKDHEQDI